MIATLKAHLHFNKRNRNMRIYILGLGLIALLASSPGCNSNQANTINGRWLLLKIETQDSASGFWNTSEWMKNGTGTLIYEPNGTMSVEFRPQAYGLDSSAEIYAYTASYEYNKSTGFIQHTRLTHSDPDEIGKTVRRRLDFNGDTLTMHADEFGLRLKWLAVK